MLFTLPRDVISEHTNPAGWPRGIEQNPTKTALAVFDVGIAKLRLNRKHCADLVILSTRGLYPLWLRIAVISAHVEVLRRSSAHCEWCMDSGITPTASWFNASANEAKPPQAGSHKSLMYLAEAEELFIGNRQNGGTAVSKDIPIPSKNAGIFCLTIELTPQLSVRLVGGHSAVACS